MTEDTNYTYIDNPKKKHTAHFWDKREQVLRTIPSKATEYHPHFFVGDDQIQVCSDSSEMALVTEPNRRLSGTIRNCNSLRKSTF